MKRFKAYVLPAAIVLGLLFHSQAVAISGIIPYLIFTILLLNFTAVDLRRLGLNRLDVILMVFQTAVSIGAYWTVRALGGGEVLAQAALIGVLCPVASSVVVVASELGANRATTTGYTIYGNLLVTVLAPILFSFIGTRQDMPLLESAWMIFLRIASVIALPFVIALVMQLFTPKVSQSLSRYKGYTFGLWALALLVTLGQTIDYMFLYHEGNEGTIAWLAGIAVVICAVQFAVGRMMGHTYGDAVAGAQLLGQKNTAIGIWMASVYLLPLSSVVLAFYSICQNLYNSWQLWVHQRRSKTS